MKMKKESGGKKPMGNMVTKAKPNPDKSRKSSTPGSSKSMVLNKTKPTSPAKTMILDNTKPKKPKVPRGR